MRASNFKVLLFEPAFHDSIRSGVKRSTIRVKAPCKPGEKLSLRAWSGRAHDSKQSILVEPLATCTAVTSLWMGLDVRSRLQLLIEDAQANTWEALDEGDLEDVARVEGFKDVSQMSDWFLQHMPTMHAGAARVQWIEWTLSPMHDGCLPCDQRPLSARLLEKQRTVSSEEIDDLLLRAERASEKIRTLVADSKRIMAEIRSTAARLSDHRSFPGPVLRHEAESMRSPLPLCRAPSERAQAEIREQ